MLKKLLIAFGLLIFVGIAVIAALIMTTKTDFGVEREITINKPRNEVFAYAKLVKNQNEWGPWFKRDPAMKQEFSGTDGTVGFISKWESQNPEVGSGEQEIKRIVENERIETELRFKQPFESKADAYLTTETAGENQTRVKWGFKSSMPKPMNLLLLVMDIEKEIGKDYESGLDGLKKAVESMP